MGLSSTNMLIGITCISAAIRRRLPRRGGTFAMLLVVLGCAGLGWSVMGCSAGHPNPSFPVTIDAARKDLTRMEEHRTTPPRPIVVLGGYWDPGLGPLVMGGEVRDHFKDVKMIGVSFMFCDSLETCRAKVIAAVERNWPSGDP